MARKPDVFQKIVDKLVSGSFPSDELLITKAEAVCLLRRYHARVRRLVKKYQRFYQGMAHARDRIGNDPYEFDMKCEAITNIIQELDRIK